jgi:hypothetical protein
VTAWRGQLAGGTIETNWSLAYASGGGDLRVIGGSDRVCQDFRVRAGLVMPA